MKRVGMKKINVSVIGLSGSEKDKGQIGVGKSCLCNRFVRPAADDYFIDHISVLSQTDFSGRIVNNDHFLFWGGVEKCTEEGIEYYFQVIEQTEFMDDSTFHPFKVGKMEAYTKRCTALKVMSAEKLMYICKNQLGVEKEYEQKLLPEGRLIIDGFLVLFDVSLVPNRPIEKQIDFANNVITAILKLKKPLIFVTTKNDDAREDYIREAEKICQKKEYKGLVQLIETSAHESINIDMAFIAIAQMIDKAKIKTKIVSYQEAVRSRKELLDTRTEAVMRLIRNHITDCQAVWSQSSKLLAQYREWNEFLHIFGQEAGQKVFRRHMKMLHDNYLDIKLSQYIEKLACVMQNLIPDINSLKTNTEDEWTAAKNFIRNHRDFHLFFYEKEQGSSMNLNTLDDKEAHLRIPFDVLETSEAETVFRNYLNSVQRIKKESGWKQELKLILEESTFVTPGKPLSEVRVFFMGRECFEALSEHDSKEIYDIHQKELLRKSKQNFIELLLEHAQLFLQFKTPNNITQEAFRHISDMLRNDLRYKMLDRLDQERNTILFQHLDFIQCPNRENCFFNENCVDNLIDDILIEKAFDPYITNKWHCVKDVNLLIMGSEHLTSDLLNDIRVFTGINGEYIYESQTFFLNFGIASTNIDIVKLAECVSSGLICVYSDIQSLEVLEDNFKKTILNNLEIGEKFENIPIVIVFQPQDLNETQRDCLRAEGIRLSEILHCEFIENQQDCHQKYVHEILDFVIRSLKLSDINFFESTSSNIIDIRIILCVFCGDQYGLDKIVIPLLTESSLCRAAQHSVIIDVFIGDSKRRVEFILSSYHDIVQYNDELIHGFVYFYSAKRRSSLLNLNVVASQNCHIPSQIIAITENGGADEFFNSDMCQRLITEGNELADRYKGNFMTFSVDQYIKLAFYIPFLKKVFGSKLVIEVLRVDPLEVLHSEENTLENSAHHVSLSPRNGNNILSNILAHNSSDSENCQILPTSNSLNSLNDFFDDTSPRKCSDKNDIHPNFSENSWNNVKGSIETNTSGCVDSSPKLSPNKLNSTGPSLTLNRPGKLDLENFQLINEAVARINFTAGRPVLNAIDLHKDSGTSTIFEERELLDNNYVREIKTCENISNIFESEGIDDCGSCVNSTDKKMEISRYFKLNRMSNINKKTKSPIPVQSPRIPYFGPHALHSSRICQKIPANFKANFNETNSKVDCNIDIKGYSTEDHQTHESANLYVLGKIVDSTLRKKYVKQEQEKDNRSINSLKERNTKLKKLEEKDKKLKRKPKHTFQNLLAENLNPSVNEYFMTTSSLSGKKNIPVFLLKCVEYIEKEGLDSEGIYRVPGSRTHVDALFQSFQENFNFDIKNMSIPVNAVATALKDFFSKHLPPLLSKDIIEELEEISGSRNLYWSKSLVEGKVEKSSQMTALKALLIKLPDQNLEIMKYVFQHFVHVADHSKYNSMDSKNLAICWWPTLIPIDFTDMAHFERLRPYLEDVVQTMIDQYPYLFCSKDDIVMV